jgi:molybdate transport system substrate-binding protein
MRAPLFALLMLSAAGSARAGELLVFAAASTTEAMQELGTKYEAKTGTRVRFSFAGSSELARQIIDGAPADVFFSADAAQMDRVEKAGKVRHDDRVDVVSNRLVIVQPKNAVPLRSFEELAQVQRLALADPESVPAGVYAKKALVAIGVWETAKGHVIPTLDVRAALAAVEAGRADAAIVYATDVQASSRVQAVDAGAWLKRRLEKHFSPNDVEASRFFHEPDAVYGPTGLVYPAAATQRPQSQAARTFVDFLRSTEGQEVFKRRGFIPLGTGIRL